MACARHELHCKADHGTPVVARWGSVIGGLSPLANFGRVCLGTLSIAGDRRLSDLSSIGLGPNGDEVKAKMRSVLSPSNPLHLSRFELKVRECLVNPDVVVAIHSLHDQGAILCGSGTTTSAPHYKM